MRTSVADLRYAIRVLSRAPSFALAVIAVLALGMSVAQSAAAAIHDIDPVQPIEDVRSSSSKA